MTDTTSRTADTLGAMDGLGAVLKSLARRIEAVDGQLTAARSTRDGRLDLRTEELIPSIKASTLRDLKKADFRFVDDTVKRVFEAHDRLLPRLFGAKGYLAALALLRTRMKRRLEEQGYVKTEDAQIARLDADRAVLAGQQAEAMEMLKLIERAHRLQAPLPPAAVQGINHLAGRGRSIAQSAPRRQNLQGLPRTATRRDDDPPSDADLWFWITTDIPTSFRTVMLDVLSTHNTTLKGGGGTFAGGGAQGGWSNDTPSQSAAVSHTDAPQQASARSNATGFAAGFVTERLAEDAIRNDRTRDRDDAPVQAPERTDTAPVSDPPLDSDGSLQWPAQSDPAIATDDSLGKFS